MPPCRRGDAEERSRIPRLSTSIGWPVLGAKGQRAQCTERAQRIAGTVFLTNDVMYSVAEAQGGFRWEAVQKSMHAQHEQRIFDSLQLCTSVEDITQII